MKFFVTKYVYTIILLENIIIVISMISSMYFNIYFGMEFFGFIYRINIVFFQYILIILVVIFSISQKSAKIGKIMQVANLAINAYLLHLCLFTSTPDVFSWENFIFANERIIKIFR